MTAVTYVKQKKFTKIPLFMGHAKKIKENANNSRH